MSCLSRFAAVGSLTLLATCRPPTVTPPEPQTQAAARSLVRNVKFIHDTLPILRFDPPPVYAMWRAEVEQCSGLKRDGAPSFWVAPVTTIGPEGFLGMYVRPSQAILFGLGSESIAWVVRHEILHFLVNVNVDEDGHPAEYFGTATEPGRCGLLVRLPVHYPAPPETP